MARCRVRWTETARRDALELLLQLEPEQAAVELTRIVTLGQALEDGTREGRVVPELRDAGVLHIKELRALPWRLIYRAEGEHAFVLAVLDERRAPGDLLLERLVRV